MRTCIVAVVCIALAFAVIAAETPKGKTLDNLQAAYNGESNAKAKYEVYAKKADAEGFLGAAALFRAAAKAEGVHADALAGVIKKMGATPKAEIKPPAPKSTKENLEDALKGESYERDTMYPDFIKAAKAEANKDALQIFTYAKTAEAEHAKLYAAAAKDLGAWKAARSFWVCTVCGYTVPKVAFEKCPSCFFPKEKYIEVK